MKKGKENEITYTTVIALQRVNNAYNLHEWASVVRKMCSKREQCYLSLSHYVPVFLVAVGILCL